MFEELKLQVVGSFNRIKTPAATEYHFNFYAKITNQKGKPINGLTAKNFTLYIAGLESEGPIPILVAASQAQNQLPGFYKILLNETLKQGLPGFDIFAISGYLFALRVDYKGKYATAPVNLNMAAVSVP